MERRKPCPDVLRGCPENPPFADDHHLAWPASEYTSALERKYRNCEVNIVRGLCRCLHNLEHLKKPPQKPSPKEMRRVVDGS